LKTYNGRKGINSRYAEGAKVQMRYGDGRDFVCYGADSKGSGWMTSRGALAMISDTLCLFLERSACRCMSVH
jgi:hypothetical protein